MYGAGAGCCGDFVEVMISWFWVLWCGGFGLIVLGDCFPVVGSCVGDLVVGIGVLDVALYLLLLAGGWVAVFDCCGLRFIWWWVWMLIACWLFM